ncbi:MAG: PEP-CTERM sorting domain-containing protein [Leptolyngbya sp. SIO1D8]|nr:PEP-CTERM sorting domain-containing protein [Leptolyngbya sp. SIO1D8]
MAVPRIALALTLTAGTLLTLSSSAHAFLFETNDFDTNPLSRSDAEHDIFLESIKVLDNDGGILETITDFSYVQSAEIVHNDEFTGGNSGAASTDTGDQATTGTQVENATAADIAENLGNNNLNNIIDTEDKGSFEIDLHFDKVIDNLLVWERGNDRDTWGAGNSDLAIQALDGDGNLIGNYLKISRDQWKNAGFYIDTKEIGRSQEVGSLGVNIAQDLGVEDGVMSLRFFSESSFNGPDWKFVGTDAVRGDVADVPEPAFILGLGALGSALMMRKRSRIA